MESYRCLKEKFESSHIRKKQAWADQMETKWRSLKHMYHVKYGCNLFAVNTHKYTSVFDCKHL